MLSLDHPRRRFWGEEDPPLAPADQRVPGAGGQGVNVVGCTAAFRANEKPAVRRPPLLPDQSEQVLPEVLGRLVMLHERFGLRILVEATIEQVQGAVVPLQGHIF